jgi:hypothetical protein
MTFMDYGINYVPAPLHLITNYSILFLSNFSNIYRLDSQYQKDFSAQASKKSSNQKTLLYWLPT